MIQNVLAESQWYDIMEPEEFRALTPLIYTHVNPYGTFKLDMDERIIILKGFYDMIFCRKPFTDWIIELNLYDEEDGTENSNCADYADHFTAVYRTTMRSRKECEQFTLMPIEKWGDVILLQLQIFKDGSINIENHMEALINVNRRKKVINITLLCDIDYNKRTRKLEYIKIPFEG